MKHGFLVLYHLFCLSSVQFVVSPANASIIASDSNKVAQLIAQGDNYSEKVFDNQKALDMFNEALSLSPNDYEILWRLSRTYVDIGEHLPNNNGCRKTKTIRIL